MAKDFVQVNVPTTGGKRLITWTSMFGGFEVHSEGVTLTDGNGDEITAGNPLSVSVDNVPFVDVASWFGSAAPTVGQKAMVDSLPVVIASNQSPVPVASAGPSSSVVTTVAVAAAAVTLLAANPSRLGAMIYNDATTRLYVKLGAGASTANFTVRLDGFGYFELPYPAYTGIVTGIRGALDPAASAQVTELS